MRRRLADLRGRDRIVVVNAWDESKHPRRKDGEWTSGGEGGASELARKVGKIAGESRDGFKFSAKEIADELSRFTKKNGLDGKSTRHQIAEALTDAVYHEGDRGTALYDILAYHFGFKGLLEAKKVQEPSLMDRIKHRLTGR